MLVNIDVRVPGLAIRSDNVVLQRDGVDFPVGIVEDMDGSVAVARGHASLARPKDEHIPSKQLLDLEVHGRLFRTSPHHLTVVVIDRRGSAIVARVPNADEVRSRLDIAGFFQGKMGRFAWIGLEQVVGLMAITSGPKGQQSAVQYQKGTQHVGRSNQGRHRSSSAESTSQMLATAPF